MNCKKTALLICLALSCLWNQHLNAQQLVKYVNPIIGTGGTGHTFPGATRPFAMVQLSPDTRIDNSWEGCSGYHYNDDTIYGFSHTHLSGTGCSDLGDISFMPAYDQDYPGNILERDSVFSTFSHLNEKAEAGYYSVVLDNGIKAELTSTQRTGLQKYTFSKPGGVWIILNLKHRDELLEGSIKSTSVTTYQGLRRSKAWATDQRVYFCFELSKRPEDVVITSYNGGQSKAGFYFKVQEGEELIVKTALSNVSETGARLNMERELTGRDFETVKKESQNAWENELQKIKVYGGSRQDLEKFYTALYHCMIHPSVISDADSTYRGRDGLIHKASWGHYYSIFSLWDTYRALHPLLNMIEPSISRDFIMTFMAQAKESGHLPMWELWGNETHCMIGVHSIPVILDAYRQRVIDKQILADIYPAIQADLIENRDGLPIFRTKGYLETNDEHESVSKTLEYAFDFWCAAEIAKELDDKLNYGVYQKLGFGGLNLLDPATMLVRPRKNGNFISPFDPREINNYFTEGNSWQYSYYFPQFFNGSLQIEDSMAERIFKQDSKMTGRTQADVTGIIGQYAHGNEPSHHIPYLLENKSRQKIVKQICRTLYGNNEEGLCGNDDCGQMSAWYVFSAMGFYPVCPGTNRYYWGNMLFDSVRIEPQNLRIFKDLPSANEELFIGAVPISAATIPPTTNDFFELKHYRRKVAEEKMIFREPYDIVPYFKSYNVFTAPLMEPKKETLTVSHYYASLPGRFDHAFLLMSKLREEPLSLNSTTKLTADDSVIYVFRSSFKGSSSDKNESYVIHFSSTYTRYIANYKYGLQLLSTYNKQYSAGGDSGIIDGLYGTENWKLGGWQGYQGTDFNCILDLKKAKSVHKIAFNCLQDTRSWILFPKEVKVWGSTNGKKYTYLGNSVNLISDSTTDKPIIQRLQIKPGSKKKYRYLKITAVNYGKLPDWHPGKGFDAFIFVDEIVVE